MSSPERLFNPFPGLRPFGTEEAHLFFGREGQSTELLRLLREHRFLAVLGPSGSGKSSLVRAGLLPSLYGGFMRAAGSNWRIAVMRPGSDPVSRLAEILADPAVLGAADVDPLLQTTITEATLRRGGLGLVEAAAEAPLPETDNLLVVVDQFEEIFRFETQADAEERDDAAAFVKLLLEASEAPGARIYVILTMRSDYLGDCAQFRDLPEAINRGKYLIPRMTREQRRLAIEGPVAVGGGKIAPRLVSRMLNDMGSDPDQLPILQHAAMQTWKRWMEEREPDEPLDLEHYEAIGGMDSALSLHADEAYAELPNERSRVVAEKIFRRLTERGADNREIRRPTRFGELCDVGGAAEAAVAAVIETFRKPGRSFLMPPAGTPLKPETLVDISHESLIRGWDRLAGWVDEEAESAKIYRRLAETAHLWKQGRAGLWRDPDLQLALDWWERDAPNAAWAAAYDPDFDDAREFLDRSRSARDAAAKARRRRTRAVIAALAIGFIGASGLALFAAVNARAARAERDRADAERDRADSARAVAVIAQEEAVRMQGVAESSEEEARATAEQLEQRNQELLAQRAALSQAREIAEFQSGRAQAAERSIRSQVLELQFGTVADVLGDLEDETRDDHPLKSTSLQRRRARNYGYMGQWDSSITQFTAALRANPDDINALVNRSDAYLNMKRPDLAAADLEYVLERNPNYSLGHLNMAIALGQLGDYEGARASYRRAIEALQYQAGQTSQSRLSPDLERVTGLRSLSLAGSEAATAYAYALASTLAYEGRDGFPSSLSEADGLRRSQNGILNALNWAWLHREHIEADYGAHAAEGALWLRAGAGDGEVGQTFRTEAARSFCRFLDDHRSDKTDPRYAALAAWVEEQLAATRPRGCAGLERSPTVQTEDVHILFVEAAEASTRRERNRADALLSRILELEPGNLEAFLRRAAVRRDLAEAFETQANRDSTAAVRKNDEAVRDSIAITQARGADDTAARDSALRASFALARDSARTYRERAIENRAQAPTWFARAMADADSALARSPRLADAYYLRGRVLYSRASWADLLDEATVADIVREFDQAIAYDPGHGNAQAFRAWTLMRTNPQEAAKSFRAALRAWPETANWWRQLFELELGMGRHTEAKKAIEVAIGLEPENMDHYDDRAQVDAELGLSREEIDRSRAAGYATAARERRGLGDLDGAREALGGAAGLYLMLADSDDEEAPARLVHALIEGESIGLGTDEVFAEGSHWLDRNGHDVLALAALDSAIVANPEPRGYFRRRLNLELFLEAEPVEAFRRAGLGLMVVDDREASEALEAYWQATLYLTAADQLINGTDEGASVTRPLTADMQTAVTALLDAGRQRRGSEESMVEFFRELIEPDGRLAGLVDTYALERTVDLDVFEERVRWVLGSALDSRAASLSGAPVDAEVDTQ